MDTRLATRNTPLSPDERQQLEAIQKKIVEAGSEAGRRQLEQEKRLSLAKWKIQIWIKSHRSRRAALAFTLSVWESGKRLHGGGDESAFFCKRKPQAAKPKMPFGAGRHPGSFKRTPTLHGCGGVIPGSAIVRNAAVCPHCGVTWDTEQIADSIFYRVPVERASEILAEWFHELNDDADLYAKYRDDDIRVLSMAREFGVRRARELKGLTIYPHASIVQDITNGATLESRFKAFLLA